MEPLYDDGASCDAASSRAICTLDFCCFTSPGAAAVPAINILATVGVLLKRVSLM